MFQRLAVCIAAIFLSSTALFAQKQTTTAVAPDRLVFILDASGSMWGQAGGENKIVIARRVMKNLLNKLSADTKVGLVVYGHRQAKDCEDIEVVAPLAPLNATALTQKIDALNPKGMTPITGAIRKAFEAVAADKEATTFVLLSDGLETCGGDPCKAVSAAKTSGTSFIMHIIGFDVSKEEVLQLECAAQAGGGLYLSAENADELTAAFERAVAPVDPSNAVISVKAVANGELIDATVQAFQPGTRKEAAHGRTYTASTTNPRLLPVVAGEYDLEVRALRFKGEAVQRFPRIKIAPGDTLKKIVDYSIGELSIKVTRNGELSDASITVLAAGTKTSVASGRSYKGANSNPKVFQITPGTYDIVIKSLELAGDVEKKFEGVVVQSGARTEHAHEFASGTLRIGAVAGGALVDAGVQVADPASGVTVAQGRTYVSSTSNPKTFEVQPGRYRVTVKAIKSNSEKVIEVTVTAGQTMEQVVELAK